MKKVLGILLALSISISSFPNIAIATEIAENQQIIAYSQEDENVPLLVGDTYIIENEKQLLWVAESVADGNTFQKNTIALENDIDLSGEKWISIGYNLNNYFSGTFDGQGHMISGYSLIGSVNSYSIVNAPRHTTGLFGVCNGAVIKNLYVDDATASITNESGYTNSYSSIEGTNVYAGIVCGYSVDTTFQNIIVSDSVAFARAGSESAYVYSGGICGYAKNSNFVHCGNIGGAVTGESESANNDSIAGGIVGELENEGVIRQCYNRSKVYGQSVVTAAYIGGIVGKTSSRSSTLSSIRDSYNQGDIYHTGSWMESAYMGGIIGYSSSTVNRCYNSGKLSASTNTLYDAYMAGIAGYGISSSSVSNCAVMSSSMSGLDSRYIIATKGKKDNNIANSALSGTNDSTKRYALSSFYSSDIYVNDLCWDFDDIWSFNEEKYPILVYRNADMEQDILFVDETAKYIDIIFEEGDTYSKVTKNIAFTESPNKAKVEWSSSNEDVLSDDGIVTRNEDDYQIKLNALISSGKYSVTKTFVLNIVGTGMNENIVLTSQDWAFSLDDARTFVAYMKGVRFRDIPADDPDVQVLIGADVSEESVTNTLTNVMKFWEVPNENEIIKSNIGDIVQYLKDGEEKVISSMVKDVTGGKVTWEDGAAKYDMLNISKMLIKHIESAYKSLCKYSDAYKILKGVKGYKFDDSSTVKSSLELGDKVTNVFVYIYNYVGPNENSLTLPITFGKISKWIQSGLQAVQIMDAWDDSMENSVKEYLRIYSINRPNFESAEDESFKAIMSAVDLTNFTESEETLDKYAESIYQLSQKCGANNSDEYKIIIKCPVNVEVYDSKGMIVGRVIDNEVDNTIRNSLLITVGGINNDEKTIYIQDDEEYSISMIGNDEGEMTVSIEGVKDNSIVNYDYNDIELKDGKEMSLSISNNDIKNELPFIYVVDDGVITNETEEVDEENISHNLIIYPCLEKEDGTVEINNVVGNTICDYYLSGYNIKELVIPNEGYKLEGLYTELECVNKYAYEVMPDKELVLYAKFIPASTQEKELIASGKCGQNVSWELTVDGELLIDGKGEMDDYTANTIPWFAYKDKIKNVEVGNGVTYVGNNSFAQCENIENISISDDIEAIGESIIAGCNKVNKITVPFLGASRDENGTKDSVLGYWFGIDNDGLVQYYNITEDSLKGYGYAIPSSLTTVIVTDADVIPIGAFSNCKDLTQIVLNEGVSYIRDYSFYNCSAIEDITVPDTVIEISEYALNGCNSLCSITLPFIGANREANGTYEGAFGYIFGRTSSSGENSCIQYSVLEGTSLSGYAYAVPSSLTNITITDATIVPVGAFSNMVNLNTVKLNSGVKNIDVYAFYNVTSLTDIYYNDWKEEWDNISIEDGNDILDSVTIHFLDTKSKLRGASLRLTGDIGINFYYELKEEIISDDNACVEITFKDGKVDSIPIKNAIIDTETIEGKTLYKFTSFVSAKQMNDIMTIQVKAGNFEEKLFEYSIKKYVNEILSSDNYSNELKYLVKTMIYYGANSQKYLRYNIEDLVDDDIDISELESAAEEVSTESLGSYISEKSNMPEGISLYGANLSLKSELVVRYHFILDDGHDISEYRFTIDDEEYIPRIIDGRYCIEIDSISASDIDNMFLLKVTDKNGVYGTIKYGALTYARNVIKFGASKYSKELIDVVKSIYLYNLAADNYVATL